MLERMNEVEPVDQEEAENAFEMLKSLARDHPEIQANTWVSAFISCVADIYTQNGPHSEFSEFMIDAIVHYKSWFKEECE